MKNEESKGVFVNEVSQNDVLYLCNGKRCGNGHDCRECRHTLQIEYAANFQRIECNDGAVFFKENEPKKGEWIKDIQGDTICKNCGFECLYNEEGMYSLGRYCHHCGASMIESEEDNENR